MRRSVFRRLLTARWLVGLLVALVAAAVMLRLGQWQLGRAERTSSLQNYAYALEWLLFAAFTLFCFYKLFRDEDEVQVDGQCVPDVVVPPRAVASQESDDPELAAYNAYLAQLNDAAEKR